MKTSNTIQFGIWLVLATIAVIAAGSLQDSGSVPAVPPSVPSEPAGKTEAEPDGRTSETTPPRPNASTPAPRPASGPAGTPLPDYLQRKNAPVPPAPATSPSAAEPETTLSSAAVSATPQTTGEKGNAPIENVAGQTRTNGKIADQGFLPLDEILSNPRVEEEPDPATEPVSGSGLRIVPDTTRLHPEDAVPYTFNFLNAPLEPIFEMFTELTGKMVLYSPEVTGTVNLVSGSIELNRGEAIEAIISSLSLGGIVLVPMGERFVKAIPRDQSIQHSTMISEADPDVLFESGEFITRKVSLQQIKPTDAVEILQPLTSNPEGLIPIDSSQTLIVHSDATTMKQMLEVIKSIDVTPELEHTLEVIPIRYGKVDDLFQTLSSLISGSAGTPPTTPGGSTAPLNQGLGGMQGGRFGGSSFGGSYGGGYGSQIGRSYGSQYGGGYGSQYGGSYGGGYRPYQATRTTTGTVAQNRTSFQDNLRKVIAKAADEEEVQILSQAKIVPDYRSNSLLIFATKSELNLITNMVSKVDHLLAQVVIEAIVLEIGLGDQLNVGVSLSQNQDTNAKWRYGGSVGGDASFTGNLLTNIVGEGFNYLGNYNDTLQAAVTAISRDTSVQVISRPRIQTSHAIPGYFNLGESVPFVSGNTYGGYSNFAQQQVQFLEIGINISVVPFITPEGYITMEILQTFNERGEDIVINGNATPSTTRREASATLTVKDGDTIMLGGFIRQSKNKSRSGVPILKDIPLLGTLFRTKTNDSQRNELIILLRATVLKTPEEAAAVAATERDDVEILRQMEQEFEEERRKSVKPRPRWFR